MFYATKITYSTVYLRNFVLKISSFSLSLSLCLFSLLVTGRSSMLLIFGVRMKEREKRRSCGGRLTQKMHSLTRGKK